MFCILLFARGCAALVADVFVFVWSCILMLLCVDLFVFDIFLFCGINVLCCLPPVFVLCVCVVLVCLLCCWCVCVFFYNA